jgi:hypothetical protein
MIIFLGALSIALLSLASLAGWHTIAYYGTQTASNVNVKIASVPDSIFTAVPSGNLVSPQPGSIILAYGGGANMLNARLNTPKYRAISLPSLVPINTALAIPSPPNLVSFLDTPLPINAVDELEFDSSVTAAGNDVEVGLLWIKFNDIPYTPGTKYRIRATATVTCAAGTWVNGTITLDQTLPAGIYAIVGMLAWGTNLAAARLVFPSGAARPGVLASNAAGAIPAAEFAKGSLGCFGLFESINLPAVDFLSIGACTAQTVFLDVIYQSSTSLLGTSM